MKKLYIDDIRNPKSEGFIVLRSSEAVINFIKYNSCPEYISFDHDLGGEDTSMVIVKWLIENDLNFGGSFIPINFKFEVHSANVCGTANIEGYLNSYLKQRG